MLINTQWVMMISKRTLKERQMTVKTQSQNLQDAAKAVLSRNFIVTEVHSKKKKKKSQIDNLNYHLKKLEGHKPKIIRQKCQGNV